MQSFEILEYLNLTDDITDLIQSIFPATQLSDALANPENSPFLGSRAILCPTYDVVSEINDAIISTLPSESFQEYLSLHRVSPDVNEQTHRLCTHDYMSSVTSTDLQSPTLKICRGMIMMLIRNISVANGLCNGTRVIVLHHSRREVYVRVLGIRDGDRSHFASIPRVTLNSKGRNTGYPFARKQFPLRPCFAMTISKSQGQTLQSVGIDLCTTAFLHGQCYVAFSRASSVQGIKVLSRDRANRRVPNLVYPEVLEYLNTAIEPPNLLEQLTGEQLDDLLEDQFGLDDQDWVAEGEDEPPAGHVEDVAI